MKTDGLVLWMKIGTGPAWYYVWEGHQLFPSIGVALTVRDPSNDMSHNVRIDMIKVIHDAPLFYAERY